MQEDPITTAMQALGGFVDVATNHATRLSPLYLVTSALMAALVWLALRPRASLWKFLFPRRLWLHPSTRVDAQLWLLNRVGTALGAFGTAGATVVVTTIVLVLLGGRPGGEDAAHPLFVGFLALVATDFAVYWVHRLHHEKPVLWPFHAVHHSAEVMTPVTVYRKHPVYDVLSALARGAIYGVMQGAVLAAFAGSASVAAIAGVNAFYFAFNLLGANLRHSHVWLSYGRVLEHVFISPAQHQVHHSRAVEHHDKNYGEVLAIWDWMFGTLYVPQKRERLRFGLAERDGTPIPQPHPTVRAALIGPVRDCAAAIRGRGAKDPQTEKPAPTPPAAATGDAG